MSQRKINRLKSRLKSAYIAWLNCGKDMDCGLHMARHIRPSEFAAIERRCQKYAKLLRELGEPVPPVPGEPNFK